MTPGIGVKRWLSLLLGGIFILTLGLASILLKSAGETFILTVSDVSWAWIVSAIIGGMITIGVAVAKLSHNLLAPYRRHQQGHVIDVVYEHSKRQKGIKLVAIGGGTGLPAVLRGMKPYTSNITAIVTVADDGGSSGRLRRDLGILPPGDLRNNIAALADDESLMTRLFQYRFHAGELSGHAFGNLFIAALAAVVSNDDNQNTLAEALIEVERVLNIQGRVLPATLNDVRLTASVKLKGTNRTIKVKGESQIESVDGVIEDLSIDPLNAEAYPESVRAILDADLIVIGPGSLYTSIIPNLMVRGIADAVRASSAYKIYVCNVAVQPVETEGYTTAEHVLALERYIGRGVFQVVLANNAYPVENAGEHTRYVYPAPDHHEILQRYEVQYTDLTHPQSPWRHDPQKLAAAILKLSNAEKTGGMTAAMPVSNNSMPI